MMVAENPHEIAESTNAARKITIVWVEDIIRPQDLMIRRCKEHRLIYYPSLWW